MSRSTSRWNRIPRKTLRPRRRKCRTSPFISIKPVPRHLTSGRYIYFGAHVVRTYAFIYVYRIAVSRVAFVFIRAGRYDGKKWCGKWAEKWPRKWSSWRLPVRGINRTRARACAPARIGRIPFNFFVDENVHSPREGSSLISFGVSCIIYFTYPFKRSTIAKSFCTA